MVSVQVKSGNIVEKSKKIGELAVEALVQEVKLAPKPGLVDRFDDGSHEDLSVDLMVQSAFSLQRTFERIALASYQEEVSRELRESIAAIGRDGEAAMFKVTKGINTHKGAIWALGLITSAYMVSDQKNDPYEILKTAGEIASFQDRNYIVDEKTNGDVVKDTYGIKGARGEAEAGFPNIRYYGLPAFKQGLDDNCSIEHTLLITLLHLMMHVDDTCILHRAGMSGLEFVKREAKKALDSDDFFAGLKTMNEQFKERNISPGGSADLLAAIIYLHLIMDC